MAVHEAPKSLDLEVLLTRRLDGGRLRVPPYPAVALRLQRIAEDDRCTTRELSEVISADAALAVAVLQRANSAASATACFITSLESAATRLGVDQLIRLALSQSVGRIANAPGELAELRRDIWRRSLLAARMAMELAEARRVDPNAAFVAGLLHDVGAITVLVALEDLQVDLPVLPAATWRVFVDKLQPRFTSAVVERWHLPAPISAAIGHELDSAHRPLVELVATALRAIAVLDRAPDTGIAALIEVPGLSRDERYRIGLMVREIADFMAMFETAQAPREIGSAVGAPVAVVDDSWPVRFLVEHKHGGYIASRLSPTNLVLEGAHPLQPNWLVPLVLRCEPPVEMLANVKRCERAGDGTYSITVQPFGLDGKDKQAWIELIARTRPR